MHIDIDDNTDGNTNPNTNSSINGRSDNNDNNQHTTHNTRHTAQHIFLMPSRQVVYTPRRAVPDLSQHEFSCSALSEERGPKLPNLGHGCLSPAPPCRRPRDIA